MVNDTHTRRRRSDHLTHGTTTTVASLSDEYDGLNALLVALVVLPTKPCGLHNAGRTMSFCDRSARISVRRRSMLNAPAPPHCALSEFRPLDISDVIKAVKLLPDKQCSADPMPTWLLKECADVLALFLCHMFNASQQQGYVPSIFKSASSHRCLKSLTLTRPT